MIEGIKEIELPARLKDSLKPLLRLDLSVNLTAWIRAASPNDIADGLTWYPKARAFAADRARFYGLSLQTVCGVISALSPATSWAQNLIDLETVLQARAQGFEASQITVTTYDGNKYKALEIAKADNVEFTAKAFDKANKTRNFYRNLLGCGESVTVDRHAVSAALSHNAINLTTARYELLSDAYRLAAKAFSYSPAEAQAIVWITYRRITEKAARYGKDMPF